MLLNSLRWNIFKRIVNYATRDLVPSSSPSSSRNPLLQAQMFPAVQGSDSKTFTRPPLDGSLTFPELLAFHAAHSSSHKLFVYSEGDEMKSIDYATAFRAQIVAAGLVKAVFDAGKHLYVDKVARPVFGILAIAGQSLDMWHASHCNDHFSQIL